MSFEDPFASAPVDSEAQDAPADNPQPAAATSSPAPVVVTGSASGDLSVTFKGDGSYGSPWIVPKYSSVDAALIDFGVYADEVAKLGQGQKWFALFDRATKMAKHFAGLGGGPPNRKPANVGGQSRAPQQAQEAPGGEERFCEHGKMEFKSGVSSKGKAYKLFSCTAPRDQQCKAQFLN